MGKAAKITRGGNKKRVNPGRAEAKQKALGAKTHATSAKEAAESRLNLKRKSQAIAGELKAKASLQQPESSVVRMAPRRPPPPTSSAPANKNNSSNNKSPNENENEEA